MTQTNQGWAKSVAVTTIGSAIPPLASLVTAPLLAQGLGVEARGQVAAAQAVSLLAVALTAFGLPDALTYYVASRAMRSPRTNVAIISFTLGSGVIAVVVALLFSEWLAGGDALTQRLILLATLSVVPSLLLGIARAWAAGNGLWGRIAVERIIGSAVRLIGAVALFATGTLNPTSATILMTFGPLAGATPYLRMRRMIRRSSSKPQVRFPTLLSYSSRVWIGAVSGILLMRIDQAILVPFAGATELGLYAVAASISELPLVINSSVRDVAFTRQSSEFSVDQLARAARMSSLLCAVAALGLAAVLPWGIPTLFGKDFTSAIPMTWVLLVAVVIGTPGSIAGAGLSALGKPELRSISLTVAAVVNVLLLVASVPHFGAMGAVTATLVGNLVSSNLNIYWFNARSGATWRSFYRLTMTDIQLAFQVLRQASHRVLPARS